jgi:F-type H+-transporting ATPase subunit gamma
VSGCTIHFSQLTLTINKMANLKEIRRITSVSSTMQITSAMKMVSAAKLKKAQDDYSHASLCRKINGTIKTFLRTLRRCGGEYTTQREKKVLVVAITSNRGLCGAFNSNVIKASKSRSVFYAGKQVDVLQ